MPQIEQSDSTGGTITQVIGVMLMMAGVPAVIFFGGTGRGILLGIASIASIIGVVAFLVGRRIPKRNSCSDCGTKLFSDTVTVCPGCHARFGQPWQ